MTTPPLLLPPSGDSPSSEFNPALLPGATDRTPEFEAMEFREQAFAARHERVWRGKPLLPWTRERDSLLSRLRELDLPGDDFEDVPGVQARYAEQMSKMQRDMQAIGQTAPVIPFENVIDLNLYLPGAAKLLFLALHEPADIIRIRGTPTRFLAAIEEWSATNILDHEMLDACLLAAEVRGAWKKFRAMHRPSTRGRGDDSGN